jgi:hypothetical protein
MSADRAKVLISGRIVDGIESVLKPGAFPLAIGFIGLCLMYSVRMEDFATHTVRLHVGWSLTAVSLIYFLVKEIQRQQVRHRLRSLGALLDGLQDIALQLTHVAEAESVACRHLERIRCSIDAVLPLVRDLPVIGPALLKAGVWESTEISESIRIAINATPQLLQALQKAIESGDLPALNQCKQHLLSETMRLGKK